MKKEERQDAIRELLRSSRIANQRELVDTLKSRGFDVTQATISRDIKEMQLVKVASPGGGYTWALPDSEERDISDRLIRILRDCLVSVDFAGHMIVVKTLSGSANIAAETLDTMQWPEILGSIAGDNTILLVARTQEEAAEMTSRIRAMATRSQEQII